MPFLFKGSQVDGDHQSDKHISGRVFRPLLVLIPGLRLDVNGLRDRRCDLFEKLRRFGYGLRLV